MYTDKQNNFKELVKNTCEYDEAIVSTMRESLVVLDLNLNVVSANESFYKTFQVTKEETEGRRIYDLGNHQWDIPELRVLLEEILPKNIYFENYEITHEFETIGLKTMLLNARRLDRAHMILLVIEDITEKKKLAEYATQESKLAAVGLLSAGMAHGLNSPLTGILNFLQVYLKQEERGSQKYQELKLMLDACVYMGEMIKNLTHFTGDSQKQFSKISLEEVIESTLPFIERQLVASNISIEKDLSTDLVMVMGNKSQLQHVLLNVILNAKDATSEHGKIIIKARNSDDHKFVILEIIDNGTGISKENLPKLFTPFFTTKSASGGVGLGLASAYGIIKSHRGSIAVESEINKGTKIIIHLPVTI